MKPPPFLLLLQMTAVCHQLNQCKWVLTPVFFSLSYEKYWMFLQWCFIQILFKTSCKEERETVAPEFHCQLCHTSPETAVSCFGIFVLYIAAEGCLHSHFSTALILLCVHEMNEWLRSVLDSVACQVALLKLGRRSHFLPVLKMR